MVPNFKLKFVMLLRDDDDRKIFLFSKISSRHFRRFCFSDEFLLRQFKSAVLIQLRLKLISVVAMQCNSTFERFLGQFF